MSRDEISDQLLTLLTAGHETTSTTLAWAVERLRRHPRILDRLRDETDQGGSELREATITEVQRVRPVIDRTGRQPGVRLEAAVPWLTAARVPLGHLVPSPRSCPGVN